MLLLLLGVGTATPSADPRGSAGGSTELLSRGGPSDHLLSTAGGENETLSSGGVNEE